MLYCRELERTLASLIAYRAVERVVDERELYSRFPRLYRFFGIGFDYEAFSHEGVAGGHDLGHTLHLDQALPALGDYAEGRMIAEMRHVDADAVSVTLPVSPAAGAAMVAGDTVKVHAGGGAAAACVTVKARPAIVSVAERSAASVLALTANCT